MNQASSSSGGGQTARVGHHPDAARPIAIGRLVRREHLAAGGRAAPPPARDLRGLAGAVEALEATSARGARGSRATVHAGPAPARGRIANCAPRNGFAPRARPRAGGTRLLSRRDVPSGTPATPLQRDRGKAGYGAPGGGSFAAREFNGVRPASCSRPASLPDSPGAACSAHARLRRIRQTTAARSPARRSRSTRSAPSQRMKLVNMLPAAPGLRAMPAVVLAAHTPALIPWFF